MFRKKVIRIINDDGFTVEEDGFHLMYREGDKILRHVQCEYGVMRLFRKSNYMHLYLGFPEYWEAPYNKEKISQNEWIRIGDNIKKAYLSKGITINYRMMTPEEISSIECLEKAVEDKKKGIPPNIKTFEEWKNEQGLK